MSEFMDKNTSSSMNLQDRFRLEEKRIRSSWREMESQPHIKKRKNYSSDSFDEVINSWIHSMGIKNVSRCNIQSKVVDHSEDIELGISSDACVMKAEGTPDGLYIIKNALSLETQLYWARVCVEEYSSANHTNLTNLKQLGLLSHPTSHSATTSVTEMDENRIWYESLRENNNFLKFKTLRWASLGYHYDWTARKYQKDLKSLFPFHLATYCKLLANYVGDDITAEAAIINYYPSGTSMSGHLDDAELTMDEPIVSISIGCPAIFLIGGRTKDIQPASILLESGDVVIMSGESRYCFHGIPIVLPPFHKTEQMFINAMAQYPVYHDVISYLMQSRINMNVRRVLPPGAEWIDKQGSGAKSSLPLDHHHQNQSKTKHSGYSEIEDEKT